MTYRIRYEAEALRLLSENQVAFGMDAAHNTSCFGSPNQSVTASNEEDRFDTHRLFMSVEPCLAGSPPAENVPE